MKQRGESARARESEIERERERERERGREREKSQKEGESRREREKERESSGACEPTRLRMYASKYAARVFTPISYLRRARKKLSLYIIFTISRPHALVYACLAFADASTRTLARAHARIPARARARTQQYC